MMVETGDKIYWLVAVPAADNRASVRDSDAGAAAPDH